MGCYEAVAGREQESGEHGKPALAGVSGGEGGGGKTQAALWKELDSTLNPNELQRIVEINTR